MMHWVKRETTDRQTERETEMKSAGGEPCLYMHGWWKNVSLNGSQLSTALRTAKTCQGNKIWHYYYYPAIINYPLSPLLSPSPLLPRTGAHVHADSAAHAQTSTVSPSSGCTSLGEIPNNASSDTRALLNLHF